MPTTPRPSGRPTGATSPSGVGPASTWSPLTAATCARCSTKGATARSIGRAEFRSPSSGGHSQVGLLRRARFGRLLPPRRIILSQAVVAERYTRRSQKPLGASPWGFESPLRHPDFTNKTARSATPTGPFGVPGGSPDDNLDDHG